MTTKILVELTIVDNEEFESKKEFTEAVQSWIPDIIKSVDNEIVGYVYGGIKVQSVREFI